MILSNSDLHSERHEGQFSSRNLPSVRNGEWFSPFMGEPMYSSTSILRQGGAGRGGESDRAMRFWKLGLDIDPQTADDKVVCDILGVGTQNGSAHPRKVRCACDNCLADMNNRALILHGDENLSRLQTLPGFGCARNLEEWSSWIEGRFLQGAAILVDLRFILVAPTVFQVPSIFFERFQVVFTFC